MAKPQIRSSQLITTFGPGAMVDLPDHAVIIGGLEGWRYSRNTALPTISEPRLVHKLEELLQVQGLTLRKPPPAIEDKGFTPDITTYRFPEWFIVQKAEMTPRGHRARRLVKWNDLEKGRCTDSDGKKQSVVPVRFVRACERGHVGDIDWRAFVHGEGDACAREMYLEERGTTGDLDSVWVRCGCGAERRMAQAAQRDLKALGSCDGSRPWLGPLTKERCGVPSRLLIRSASNAYFPQLLAVISIPEAHATVDEAVRTLWDAHLAAVESIEELRYELRKPLVSAQLKEFAEDDIMAAIRRIREGQASDTRPVKEAEFEALSTTRDELGSDQPEGDFYARTLPVAAWHSPQMQGIDRVVLVHRLREVVAQVGFTRFEAAGPDIDGELSIDVQRAPLAIDTSWLPAIENRGEGIFLQFNPAAIAEWTYRDPVQQRDRALQVGFKVWLDEHEGSTRVFPGTTYFMLHTLAHLLITAISLECGYPSSSLRERIYCRPSAGQYGILLYTGSSDAEGTLGGLVAAGRRIKHHMKRALDQARLCSNDPVCAFHVPDRHDHQPLQGSACHGCVLIAETCCEQHNDFLDRALVVPTVELLNAEFFT